MINDIRIVQSFWSKPFLKIESSIKEGRKFGGFRDKRFFYFSWALSSLLIKKYYGHLELVTDNYGKDLLIDKLNLPYDSFSMELNTFSETNPDLWALGKIKAYELQKKPFLHLDGDVFIWGRMPKILEKAPLVAQNMDKEISPELMKSIEGFYSSQLYRPSYMNREARIKMYNAGIFGGNDIDFFQEYVEEAYRLIFNNLSYLDNINVGNFNMIFEQLLFYNMVKDSKKEVVCLLDKVDKSYSGLANFREVPSNRKFIHLVGKYKLYEEVCRQLEVRLLLLFPKSYYLIIDLLENNEI